MRVGAALYPNDSQGLPEPDRVHSRLADHGTAPVRKILITVFPIPNRFRNHVK